MDIVEEKERNYRFKERGGESYHGISVMTYQ